MGTVVLTGVYNDLMSSGAPSVSNQARVNSALFKTPSLMVWISSATPSPDGIDNEYFSKVGHAPFNWKLPTQNTGSSISNPLSSPQPSAMDHSIATSTTSSPLASRTVTTPDNTIPLSTEGTPSSFTRGMTTTTSSTIDVSTTSTCATLDAKKSDGILRCGQDAKGQNAMIPVVVTVVSCLVMGLVGCALYFWWRRKKMRRMQQEESLEDEAVWFSKPRQAELSNQDNGQPRGRLMQRSSSPGKRAPSPLPSKHNKRARTAFEEFIDAAPTNHAHHTADPFATPTSQRSPARSVESEGHQLRASQIGLAITTSHSSGLSDPDDSDLESVQTAIHHGVNKTSPPYKGLSPGGQRTTSQNETSCEGSAQSCKHLARGRYGSLGAGSDHSTEHHKSTTNSESFASDHEIDPSASDLQEDVFSDANEIPDSSKADDGDKSSPISAPRDFGPNAQPSTENKEREDLELARRFIRSLKKEAFEAQKAAAAAEHQARDMREQM